MGLRAQSASHVALAVVVSSSAAHSNHVVHPSKAVAHVWAASTVVLSHTVKSLKTWPSVLMSASHWTDVALHVVAAARVASEHMWAVSMVHVDEG